MVDVVRQSSVDLPGGAIKTENGDILLRTKGQAYRGDDFARIVLLTDNNGTRVTLGDVAAIKDGFVEDNQFSEFDGKPAVNLRWIFLIRLISTLRKTKKTSREILLPIPGETAHFTWPIA